MLLLQLLLPSLRLPLRSLQQPLLLPSLRLLLH
jgi:hypothetical protein